MSRDTESPSCPSGPSAIRKHLMRRIPCRKSGDGLPPSVAGIEALLGRKPKPSGGGEIACPQSPPLQNPDRRKMDTPSKEVTMSDWQLGRVIEVKASFFAGTLYIEASGEKPTPCHEVVIVTIPTFVPPQFLRGLLVPKGDVRRSDDTLHSWAAIQARSVSRNDHRPCCRRPPESQSPDPQTEANAGC